MLLMLNVALILCVFAMLGLVSVTITRNISGLVAQAETQTVTDVEGIVACTTLPAAQPSTLTTRTLATAGTLTMTNTSHGIITGQRIDLYWSNGQAYAAVVGTVAGTSVPFTAAVGTLPIATTPITVGIPVQVACNITGNNMSAMILNATQSGYFVFDSVAPADLFAAYVIAGQLYLWKTGDVAANPLAGVTAVTVWMSHSYVTAAVTTNQATILTH